MSKINKVYLKDVLSTLGQQLSFPNAELTNTIQNECHYNAWFTPGNVASAVKAIGQMLNGEDISKWLDRYELASRPPKRVGLILAGNIPLVGFHDVLCVLVSGNYALIKASSQDTRLIKQVLDLLCAIEAGFSEQFSFVEKLQNFDAVIATGSNNTSRYFEYYFGKVPHVIRKNRNSVAVLTGDETNGELHDLGRDIFDYFGLGCRNVSKLFVPAGYDFTRFFEAIEPYHHIIHHHKYHNNYDYNKSIYLVNRDPHLDNGFLLVKEDKGMSSPLAVLFYEYYAGLNDLQEILAGQKDNIQCIVTSFASRSAERAVAPFLRDLTVAPGQSQHPRLWDYADGVDTMNFLTKL